MLDDLLESHVEDIVSECPAPGSNAVLILFSIFQCGPEDSGWDLHEEVLNPPNREIIINLMVGEDAKYFVLGDPQLDLPQYFLVT